MILYKNYGTTPSVSLRRGEKCPVKRARRMGFCSIKNETWNVSPKLFFNLGDERAFELWLETSVVLHCRAMVELFERTNRRLRGRNLLLEFGGEARRCLEKTKNCVSPRVRRADRCLKKTISTLSHPPFLKLAFE